jgi:hypothetical protein
LTESPFELIVLLSGSDATFPPPMATIPTIHLNGTSGEDLKREYHTAYKAIDVAMDALAAATLNGRDFYVQSPHAYSQAREERDAAFAKLREAQAYVEEMLGGICDQLPL